MFLTLWGEPDDAERSNDVVVPDVATLLDFEEIILLSIIEDCFASWAVVSWAILIARRLEGPELNPVILLQVRHHPHISEDKQGTTFPPVCKHTR